jgi:hypothetical protein
MNDPVISTILNTGGLSLQELFARTGTQLGNRLRVANLLKNGDVRLELTHPSAEVEIENEIKKKIEKLEELFGELQKKTSSKSSSSEELAAALLDSLSASTEAANDIEIIPTLKAWRNPDAT